METLLITLGEKEKYNYIKGLAWPSWFGSLLLYVLAACQNVTYWSVLSPPTLPHLEPDHLPPRPASQGASQGTQVFIQF